jgi:hypothetical protein
MFRQQDITCKECGLEGKIADWQHCESYVCKACFTVHTILGVDVKKQSSIYTKGKPSYKLFIPMGAVFRWHGKDYEVIGFCLRADQEHYYWQEYVALHESGRHIHLSQYDGHWNVVEPYDEEMKSGAIDKNLDSRDYKLWSKYTSNAIAAEGSFPYNLLEWKSYKVVESISPPYILIGENADNTEALMGTYIKPKELQKCFNVPVILPYREGVGANQVFHPSFQPMHWAIGSGILLALLFVFNLMFTTSAANQVVFEQNLMVTDSSQRIPLVSSSFEIVPRRSIMLFEASTDVYNDWVELEVDLVNEQTNESRSFVIGMEYYGGVDDGYEWSEGSHHNRQHICSVQAGRYHLQITPVKSTSSKPVNVNLKVTNDPPQYRNLWITAGIMLGFTALLAIIKFFWERSRWSKSNFNPYNF